MNVKMHKGCPEFEYACKLASKILGREILPTRRQYKKWRRRQGAAWQHGQLPL